MLEFWKDGAKVECTAIYGKGTVGQVVILDNVSYGTNPDLEKYPLAAYPKPSVFTIVEKVEGKEGYYVFKDDHGKLIRIHDQHYGASEGFVYDASEWLAFRSEYTRDKLSRKDGKINQLEGHLALLKDILVKQGFRVITEAQAKELGL